MKLNLLLLRDAAAREDTATIIRIFTEHFPQLEARRNRSWRLVHSNILLDIQIAVWTPDAVYRCSYGDFARITGMYHVHGEHTITCSEHFPCSF